MRTESKSPDGNKNWCSCFVWCMYYMLHYKYVYVFVIRFPSSLECHMSKLFCTRIGKVNELFRIWTFVVVVDDDDDIVIRMKNKTNAPKIWKQMFVFFPSFNINSKSGEKMFIMSTPLWLNYFVLFYIMLVLFQFCWIFSYIRRKLLIWCFYLLYCSYWRILCWTMKREKSSRSYLLIWNAFNLVIPLVIFVAACKVLLFVF